MNMSPNGGSSKVATILFITELLISQPMLIHPERLPGLRLLDMSVPSVADPRESMTLSCTFDMGGEELNSVKWYKDEQEFFRYMPLQHPPVLTFPVAGVHLDPIVVNPNLNIASDANSIVVSSPYHRQIEQSQQHPRNICSNTQCTVTLRNLTRLYSSGAYKCEISTEAPTFRVVFSTTNVTVVALPRGSPRVEGLASSYAIDDVITANCTSGPADPPPNLSWHLNGKPLVTRAFVGPQTTSPPDVQGLVNATLALNLVAEKRHFPGPGATMELRCVATTYAVPHPPMHTAHIITLKGTHASHLHNQKLEWPSFSRAGNPLQFFGSKNYLKSIINTTISLSILLIIFR